jgi:hypothetical protein
MMSHRHDSVLHFYIEAVARGGFNTIDANARMGDDEGWPGTLMAYELFSEYRGWCRDNRVSVYDTLSMALFYKKSSEFGFSFDGNKVGVPPTDELRHIIDTRQGIHQGEAK